MGFALSWVVGLSVFSSSTQVTSSGADMLCGIDGHYGVVATVGSLSAAISRLDGIKMLLLAGMAISAFISMRRGRLELPSWLGYVAVGLVAAITVSGVGYLFLLHGPATAAWVSLPLLIVWVTEAGVTLRPRIDGQ